MWKKSVLSLIFLLLGSRLNAQETAPSVPEEPPKVTLYTEQDAVVIDIEKNLPNSRYYRYFTCYNWPKDLLPFAQALLSKCVHDMSAGPIVKKPIKLSDTLYRIDIRDYLWTEPAMEEVAQIHPYLTIDFLTKEYQERYRYMILKSGNALFRADWFIVHTLDTTRQTDLGIKTLPYYTLLYASSKIPANIDEFRERWDVNYHRKRQRFKGGIVDEGESEVSNHTRQVARKRTEDGYYWETWDHPDYDYIEKLAGLDAKRKAGEAITVNDVGAQVYLLFNGENGNRIDAADNQFVHDERHPTGRGNRVITPIGCILCHSEGINPISNKLEKILKGKVELFTKRDYNQGLQLESFYLDNINSYVDEDMLAFANSVKKITGLAPKDLDTAFRKLLVFYDSKLSLEQAALECGVSVSQFKEHVGKSTSGRLLSLLDGEKIPRNLWERVSTLEDKNEDENLSKYGLAMILVHRIPLNTSKFIDAKNAVGTPVPAKEPPLQPSEKAELKRPKANVGGV